MELNHQVTYIRKNVRSIRLHVTRDGTIICTYPYLCLKSTAEKFVLSKQDWIKKTLEKLLAAQSKKNIIRENSVAASLNLTSIDRILNEKNFSYSDKWKNCALENFKMSVEKWLPGFQTEKIGKFEIKGRAMRSLWGSCNTKKKVITLNWELLNFDQECIDYVVLHEMVHFLFIHHDKNFYQEIALRMKNYESVIKKMR